MKFKINSYIINFRTVVVTITLTVLVGCASSGRLGGGPVDKDPPVLIEETSTPNLQTNFIPNELVFSFDEYVVVNNPLQQVNVSPPLVFIPQTKARGKRVTFQLNTQEVLKEETTYTINFGEAIKDFRENNILENFSFVFSTGDVLDSLYVQGKVVDATTGKPADKVTVMLYDVLDDSIVVKSKPYYFGKTDKEGKYKISNIKNDTFKIVVIKDENSSYTYNDGVEMIGYSDDYILFSDSSDFVNVDMEISMPLIPYRIFDRKSTQKGLLRIKLNTTFYDSLAFTLSDSDINYYQKFENDSMFLYYTGAQDSFYLYSGKDTFNIKVPGDATAPKDFKGTVLQNLFGYLPKDPLVINFNYPISSFEKDSFMLSDTAGRQIDISSVEISQSGFALHLLGKTSVENEYSLLIPSGSIEDIYGNTSDSILYHFRTTSPDKLGVLILNVKGLDSSKVYTLRLLRGEELIRSVLVEDASSFIMETVDLKPDTYKLLVIEDANRNGRWDPVDYWNHKQAEKQTEFVLEKLRENWTLETEVLYGVKEPPAIDDVSKTNNE